MDAETLQKFVAHVDSIYKDRLDRSNNFHKAMLDECHKEIGELTDVLTARAAEIARLEKHSAPNVRSCQPDPATR